MLTRQYGRKMIPPGGSMSPAAEVARRHSEKAQIRDITERFRSYIQGVKSLRNQLNQADATSSAQHLQNEVITIRNIYEEEIGNLREKLEQSYRAQGGDGLSASEYQNRIREMNREILKKDEDIRALQLLVAKKESDLQALKGAAMTPSIQLEMAKHELADLQRNIVMAQTKYEEEFSQRLTLEEKVMEMTQHMEQLKYNHMKESQELRAQVSQSESLLLQVEDQLRRASHGGPALMETVQKIQEASEAEVKRLQDETESVYSQSLLELQMRLHNDQILLGQAQDDNERLQRRLEELTSQVTALEKKLFSEESNNRTLMEKMEAEHMRGRQHIEALEVRLEELQDLLLAKMKELNTFQETNVSLRNELDALKSMLEEEEQQMTSRPLPPLYTPTSSSHLLAEPFQSPVFNPLPDYPRTSDLVPELTPSDPSLLSSSTASSEGNASSTEGKPDLLFPEDEGHHSEPAMRPHTAPLWSTTTSDPRKGQSSLAAMMENNANPQAVNNMAAITGGGTKAAVSSALGDLEITEVHPGGHFVRIANRSLDKEEDIGGFLLQENIRGHPVSIYHFPPKSRVLSSCEVTVWASAAGVPHNPPTDFLWKEQNKFVTEPKCTTILCNPSGKAVAWFTPLRNKTRKSLERYEIFTEAKIPSPDLMHEPSQADADGRRRSPKSPPVYGKLEKVPRLLRREKIPPVVLPAASSPWTQSTASPTHPDFNLDRLVSSGGDGSSLCRQTRSQTAKTAPSSDVQRNSKDPNGPQRRKNNRGPIRSAGARKGSLKVLLPGSFAPISAQHRAGLQILRSVQNLHFQPPMPPPPPLTSW